MIRRISQLLARWFYPKKGTNPGHARGAVKFFWAFAAGLLVAIAVLWVVT